MGWLQRIFGKEEKEKADSRNLMPIYESTRGKAANLSAAQDFTDESGDAIPPERVGLDGQYDESGLAKRVAAAFDLDPDTADLDSVWVAQLSGTVVLKGSVPSQADLDKLIAIADEVYGSTGIQTDEVTIG
ncbi:MAG: BON domain-containing protein [Coleofasciculaceae cyanobacterium RL_1_1]|jgi:osmotically-inducible protein OsmY|nr:BON domain-containing protein [Coleofasciculaceae cyanobacterium RL_1_1]